MQSTSTISNFYQPAKNFEIANGGHSKKQHTLDFIDLAKRWT